MQAARQRHLDRAVQEGECTVAHNEEHEGLVGRDLLIDVATRLFMQDGFDGVSMQQIATAANMTKGSPYYHFKGKEDLFVHAFLQRINQTHHGLVEALNSAPTFRESLIDGFAHILATTDPGIIRLLDDYKRVISPDLKAEGGNRLITPDDMLNIYVNWFQSAADDGVTFVQPAEDVAFSFMALQMGTLHLHLIRSDSAPISPERSRKIATASVDLFLNGAVAS
jgi:AcrR family transcriptional regulator